jgi:hypothetical protein
MVSGASRKHETTNSVWGDVITLEFFNDEFIPATSLDWDFVFYLDKNSLEGIGNRE